MTREEMISKIAAKMEEAGSKITKADVKRVLDNIVEISTEELAAGNKVVFGTDFGSLQIAQRAERNGRNPKTGEAIKIPAKKAVKFVVSRALKEAVNK